MSTVEERVRAGATLLDAHVPGWAELVDVSWLNMGNCAACVIGQTFRNYGEGLDALGLNDDQEIAYGFEHSEAKSRWAHLSVDEVRAKWKGVELEYAALRAAWIAEINARLSPALDESDLAPIDTSITGSPL